MHLWLGEERGAVVYLGMRRRDGRLGNETVSIKRNLQFIDRRRQLS